MTVSIANFERLPGLSPARRSKFVGAVGALAVGTVAFSLADRSTLVDALASIGRHPLPLLGALAVYTIAFVLRAAAWGPLLPAPVPLGRRLRGLFASLAVNHALPGPVGEVARARMVTSDELPMRRALLSVAAARVVDVGAIALLLLAAALFAGHLPGWARWASPVAVVLPLAAWRVARRRGAALDGRAALRVAALAVPSWALECGVILAVAAGAGIHLGVAGALLATCAGVLAQVAAVLPGGVGTYEAGVTSALVALGVPAGEALAIATTTHMVKFVFSFAVGLPALVAA